MHSRPPIPHYLFRRPYPLVQSKEEPCSSKLGSILIECKTPSPLEYVGGSAFPRILSRLSVISKECTGQRLSLGLQIHEKIISNSKALKNAKTLEMSPQGDATKVI